MMMIRFEFEHASYDMGVVSVYRKKNENEKKIMPRHWPWYYFI